MAQVDASGWPDEIRHAVRDGNLLQAANLAERNVQKRPDEPEVLAVAADIALMRNDLRNAKRLADHCLVHAPDDVNANLRCIRVDSELAVTGQMSKPLTASRVEGLGERAFELGADQAELALCMLRSRVDTETITADQFDVVLDGLVDRLFYTSESESISAEVWTLESTLLALAATGSFYRSRRLLAAAGLFLLPTSAVLGGLQQVLAWTMAVAFLSLSWLLKCAAYNRKALLEEGGKDGSRRLYLQQPEALYPHMGAYFRFVSIRLGPRGVARSAVEIAERYDGIDNLNARILAALVRKVHASTLAKHAAQLGLVAVVWWLGPVRWVATVVLVPMVAALCTKTIDRNRARLAGETLDELDADRAYLGRGLLFGTPTLTVHAFPLGLVTLEIGDVRRRWARGVIIGAMAVGAAYLLASAFGTLLAPAVLTGGFALSLVVVLRDHDILMHRIGVLGQRR